MLSPLKPTPRPQKRTRLEPPSMAKKAILFLWTLLTNSSKLGIGERYYRFAVFEATQRIGGQWSGLQPQSSPFEKRA